MGRYLLTIMIVACIGAWLVLSYLPASVVSLPTIATGGGWTNAWFPMLTALTFAIFAAIQVMLIAGTRRIIRRPPDAGLRATVAQFQLRLGVEVFLTALPLVMTGAMVVLVYLLWH